MDAFPDAHEAKRLAHEESRRTAAAAVAAQNAAANAGAAQDAAAEKRAAANLQQLSGKSDAQLDEEAYMRGGMPAVRQYETL